MTPDAKLFLALLAVFAVLAVAYRTGSLSDERRQAAAPKAARPLGPNRLVQVDAGDRRGLCGWIQELTVDAGTGEERVTIQLNDGTFVNVSRADVSPLFG